MFAKVTPILFSVLLSTLSASSVAGGRGASAPNPVIVSASLATNPGHVTIRGYAFGTEAPVVFLGEQRLVVKKNGEKEIIAHLPENMPPATYNLLVVRNKTLQSLPLALLVMEN